VLFARHCQTGDELVYPYSIISSAAMITYFLILSDLSLLSTSISAYALVCCRVASELFLFLVGLTFCALTFACAIGALEQGNEDFLGIPKSGLQLVKMTLGMFSGSHYDMLADYPVLFVATLLYIVATVIFLVNLLVAQLTCAYQSTFQDMLGFARLKHGKIVAETMPSVSKERWQRFLQRMRLEERVEFGEGDIGLAGGVQVFEPASANITTVDMVRRFGGSTSIEAQWPEDETSALDEDDRFDRMEKLVEKAMKRMSGAKRKGGAQWNTGSSNGTGSSSALQHSSGSGASNVDESS